MSEEILETHNEFIKIQENMGKENAEKSLIELIENNNIDLYIKKKHLVDGNQATVES